MIPKDHYDDSNDDGLSDHPFIDRKSALPYPKREGRLARSFSQRQEGISAVDQGPRRRGPEAGQFLGLDSLKREEAR